MGDRVRKILIATSITLSTAGIAVGLYGHYLQHTFEKEREARLRTLVDKFKACPGRLMKVPYCYSLSKKDELRREAEDLKREGRYEAAGLRFAWLQMAREAREMAMACKNKGDENGWKSVLEELEMRKEAVKRAREELRSQGSQ